MLRDSSFVFLLLISNLIPSWSKNGLPKWRSGKESTCQCRRHRLNPWVKKIPWRRKWQPTPVFLLGKFHGQRSLTGYIVHGVAKCQKCWESEHTHILMVREYTLCDYSSLSLLNYLRITFWLRIWPVLVNVPFMLE